MKGHIKEKKIGVSVLLFEVSYIPYLSEVFRHLNSFNTIFVLKFESVHFTTYRFV